jgi:esterase/lipase superfamily enzyme
MFTTVHFATNRALTGPAHDWRSYGSIIVAPSDPTAITYATAFVDNTNLTADTTGSIGAIHNVQQGGFSQAAIPDLSEPGRNLLVFVHGFDNSFENAITRAAFNREWLAQSGIVEADTSVVAFTWPSLGRLLSLPLPAGRLSARPDHGRPIRPPSDELFRQSGAAYPARSLDREPGVSASAQHGQFSTARSVESWFSHGNGDAYLFDEAILAAPDERYDSFDFPEPGRLSSLHRLAQRISIYFSAADAVLAVSMAINLGAKRLGQDGPHDRFNTNKFPPAQYRMVDCTGFRDYNFGFASSHQYYRRSPAVRTDIAAAMAGAAIA